MPAAPVVVLFDGIIAQPDGVTVLVVAVGSVVGGPATPQLVPASAHATHTCDVASQELFVASLQSPLVAQPRQAPAEQTGVAGLLEQSEFVLQPPLVELPHVSSVVLHTCGAVQLALVVHCTHLPFWGSLAPVAHAARGAEHSVFAEQPRQLCVVASHTGVAPEQSALTSHATHAPDVLSHFGVAAVALHSVSRAQPRHVSSVVTVADLSHTGVFAVVVHCAFAMHATQVPNFAFFASTSHCGVAPLQTVPLSAAAHGRHGCVTPSQTGRFGSSTMHMPLRFDHSFCTT